MNSFAAIVAVLALAVPGPSDVDAFGDFRGSYRPEVQNQIQIEQRVIIRLVPSPPAMRREVFDAPRAERPVRYKEKKLSRCVPIDQIDGIAPLQNRLLLFMHDHRLLSATLERVCDPDAFYLGASVERNADGRLCSGRDMLRSRTGASCQISRINRLVALKD
jgi:hypothetical protein|uniref:hypothetical protein n=1 Tax=Altererythrobacter segetis TaxID=1104773 RepID=UPI00140D8AAF|nr:hypothetical protein [Altererythrobacter segetis]